MRPRFKSGRVKITKLGLKVVKHLQLILKIEKYGFNMVPLRSQEKYRAQALENHFPMTERFHDFISSVYMKKYRIYTCIEHMEYLELNSITF